MSTSAGFRVDTKLFQELGELLVGRESTALVELIKNSYDADATEVWVQGSSLHSTEQGSIVIRDNGNGMSEEDFRRGFLTIAGRTKNTGDRRSPRFNRKYTGEKGVGRLAVHKLARHLLVSSHYSLVKGRLEASVPLLAERGVLAELDWDQIERSETLDQVHGGVSVADQSVDGRETGTTLTMRKLRRPWTTRMISRVTSEVQGMVPAEELLSAPKNDLFEGLSILGDVLARDAKKNARFKVHFLGDFQESESIHTSAVASAELMIEIHSDASTGVVRYSISPAKAYATKKSAEQLSISVPWTDAISRTHEMFDEAPQQISFKARIFERKSQASPWADHLRGIRVFVEGFRVLPYGDKNDDWLRIKNDVVARSKGSLPSLKSVDVLDDGDFEEGLRLKSDQMYAGGIFLTQEGAHGLRMLINREGFLPNSAFSGLSDAVRLGIDLATRYRASKQPTEKRPRKDIADPLRAAAVSTDDSTGVSAAFARARFNSMQVAIERAKALTPPTSSKELQDALMEAGSAAGTVESVFVEALREQSIFRVLASLGLRMSSFAHEVANLLGSANSLLSQIEVAAKNGAGGKALIDVRRQADVLLRGLERQANALVDVTSASARRRRVRVPIRYRMDVAAGVFVDEMARRNVSFVNDIDDSIKSPPMFPAELTMVFVNLLSNAVKAAGEFGEIRAANDGVEVWVENTGVRVDVSQAERWFEPFESTTTKVDAALGQGMGLGLTITRSMLDDYGATIRFSEPAQGYATRVSIRFQGEASHA